MLKMCGVQASSTGALALHELKPINCLPHTRAATAEDAALAGAPAGLHVGGSGMNLGIGSVGGKRVMAPRVTGAGVTSKQPARLPPRAAVVSLEDVDFTAHKEPNELPQPWRTGERSPTER